MSRIRESSIEDLAHVRALLDDLRSETPGSFRVPRAPMPERVEQRAAEIRGEARVRT